MRSKKSNWLPSEDAALVDLAEGRITYAECLQRVGRPVTAILSRMGSKKIPTRHIPEFTAIRSAQYKACNNSRLNKDGIETTLTKATIGHIPEATVAKCRQLAREFPPSGFLSWLTIREDGWTDAYLDTLLVAGRRWFVRTVDGIEITEAGRHELLGHKIAA